MVSRLIQQYYVGPARTAHVNGTDGRWLAGRYLRASGSFGRFDETGYGPPWTRDSPPIPAIHD